MKKYINIISIVIFVFIGILVTVLNITENKSDGIPVIRGSVLQDIYDSNKSIDQTFMTNYDNMEFISVTIGLYQHVFTQGSLLFELLDENANILQTDTVYLSRIMDNQAVKVYLPLENSSERLLTLRITPHDLSEDRPIAIYTTEAEREGFFLAYGYEEYEKNLALTIISSDRRMNFKGIWYLLFFTAIGVALSPFFQLPKKQVITDEE